ncbi:MAG TPA: hypothetical protein VH834_06910, partial [Solirubrobacteraceae bacterium]
ELYLADPQRRLARPLEDRDWVTLADGREPPDEPEPPARHAGRVRGPRLWRAHAAWGRLEVAGCVRVVVVGEVASRAVPAGDDLRSRTLARGCEG